MTRRILSQIKKQDFFLSLGRLFFIIIFLGILIELSSKLSQENIVLYFISGSVLFFGMTQFHEKIKQKKEFWEAFQHYLSFYRSKKQRDFEKIKTQDRAMGFAHLSVEQNKILSSQPSSLSYDHMFDRDLDISSHLFPLMDMSLTPYGSQSLLSLLLTDENSSLREERLFQSKTLFLQPKKLRALGILKFLSKQEEREPIAFSSQVTETEGITAKSSTSKNTPPENNPSKSSGSEQEANFLSHSSALFLSFTALVFITWSVLFFLGYKEFFQTGKLDAFLKYIPFYIPLSLWGSYSVSILYKKMKFLRLSLLFKIHAILNPITLKIPFLEKSNMKSLKILGVVLKGLEMRQNVLLWILIHLVLPFDFILFFVAEIFLRTKSSLLKNLKKELAELDIIISFAHFKKDNPEFSFPEIKEGQKEAISCHSLGHPLIPASSRIMNPFQFEKGQPVILLTGSNMSGKSTFLRSLGVNLILYKIGAPLCATHFSSSFKKIICAIRIDDSLSSQTSYFYAEVKRLKKILDLIQSSPSFCCFALIDEIFRGTNNLERYQGSYSYLEALLREKAFSLISTHDLSLAQFKDTQLRLMHFSDQVKDGKLTFDYKIKEGVSPSTNALIIMKKEGLPINPTIMQ